MHGQGIHGWSGMHPILVSDITCWKYDKNKNGMLCADEFSSNQLSYNDCEHTFITLQNVKRWELLQLSSHTVQNQRRKGEER
jgi:hypothetical protein